MHILLVEDDGVTIFINKRVILTEQPQAQITVANNGREAIEELKKNTLFDLIIVDGSMPDIDGWEFMQCIDKPEFMHYHNKPFVLLTSSIIDEDFERTRPFKLIKQIHSKPLDADKFKAMLTLIEPEFNS